MRGVDVLVMTGPEKTGFGSSAASAELASARRAAAREEREREITGDRGVGRMHALEARGIKRQVSAGVATHYMDLLVN